MYLGKLDIPTWVGYGFKDLQNFVGKHLAGYKCSGYPNKFEKRCLNEETIIAFQCIITKETLLDPQRKCFGDTSKQR